MACAKDLNWKRGIEFVDRIELPLEISVRPENGSWVWLWVCLVMNEDMGKSVGSHGK